MSKTAPMTISDEEQQRRRRIIEEVRHSSYLEGGRSSDTARAIQEAYVRGQIDADEMVRQVEAHYGVTPTRND